LQSETVQKSPETKDADQDPSPNTVEQRLALADRVPVEDEEDRQPVTAG
jgi:hypothetical protein